MNEESSLLTSIPNQSFIRNSNIRYTWPSFLPLEIYLEIMDWLSNMDYTRLLHASKKNFSFVKYQTQRIRLSDSAARDFLMKEEFRRSILSRICNPYNQLTLSFQKILEDINALNVLEEIPCSIEGVYEGNFLDRKTILVNRKCICLQGCNQPAPGKMTLSNSKWVFLERFIPSGFANIITLSLFQCFVPTKILASCHSLENLLLEQCEGFTSLDGFEELKNLKCLVIDNSWDLIDISALHALNLKQLEIVSCSASDLSPAYRVTEGLSLTISNDFDYSRLSPSLKCLAIQAFFLVSIPATFSRLYEFQYYGTNEDKLQSLAGLNNVPVVYIIQSLIQDISGLGGNQRVKIRECHRIKDFSSLRNVRTVIIDACGGFNNGRDVENVKYLTLHYCAICDLSPLKHVYHLKLKLLNYPSADNMKYLRNVPILELLCLKSRFSQYALETLGRKNQKITVNTHQFHSFVKCPINFPLEKYSVVENENQSLVSLVLRDPLSIRHLPDEDEIIDGKPDPEGHYSAPKFYITVAPFSAFTHTVFRRLS